jgi:hypothetical protein
MKFLHESAEVINFLGSGHSKDDIQNVFKRVSGADFCVAVTGIPYTRSNGEHRGMEDIAEAYCEMIIDLGIENLPLETIAAELRGSLDIKRTKANIMYFRSLRKSEMPHMNVTLVRNRLLDEANIETQEKLPELV